MSVRATERRVVSGSRSWGASGPAHRGRAVPGGRRVGWGLSRLTPRQEQVLELMAAGHTNVSIARRLEISEKAVVRHVSNIYDVLLLAPSAEEHRRVVAVVTYLRSHQEAG